MKNDISNKCLASCKFKNEEKGLCVLYDTIIRVDEDNTSHLKCLECMDRDVSCSIDTKVREIYSFYHSFTQEMDIMFRELEALVNKREEIWK